MTEKTKRREEMRARFMAKSEYFGETFDDADKSENQDDRADYAIDQPHGANVEVSAYLVDEVGDKVPP